MHLHFLGATRNVTGSKYLLDTGAARVMVDYGMYQEWALKKRNWRDLPVAADSIDAVLLTHAHLDHVGLLPRLVNQGFSGKVYCTRATAGIVSIVLKDSARIQAEDAKFKSRRHAREGRKSPHPTVPLYDEQDVKAALELLVPTRYGETVEVANGVEVCFHEAGHILGSSAIHVRAQGEGKSCSLLFSGDVGRHDKPILRDPATPPAVDYVIIESTYGDRVHEDRADINTLLAEAVNETEKAGGNLIIPAFAIGRSQELLYRLNELLQEDRIPHLGVFMDSPMAIRVTDVFRRFPDLFDDEMKDYLSEGASPFEFPTLKMSRTSQQSKAINHIRGTVIVMAGSGMCTGGRVKHHLAQNIARPESTVLFVGYQANGTLGGHISRGAETIRLFGQEFRVRARIAQINGFSAHADQGELLDYLSAMPSPPKRVFVVHGEEEPSTTLATLCTERLGYKTMVPELDQKVEL